VKFQKGTSGNPGGRPKDAEVAPDIKAMARLHTVEALERLVHWLRSDNPRVSVQAAQALLDRGHGKAPQQFAIDATLRECRIDSEPLTEAQWLALYGVQTAN